MQPARPRARQRTTRHASTFFAACSMMLRARAFLLSFKILPRRDDAMRMKNAQYASGRRSMPSARSDARRYARICVTYAQNERRVRAFSYDAAIVHLAMPMPAPLFYCQSSFLLIRCPSAQKMLRASRRSSKKRRRGGARRVQNGSGAYGASARYCPR